VSSLVLAHARAVLSGPLLLRGPSPTPSGDDVRGAALVLAGVVLLLLVGASASFLHATTLGRDDPRRIRPT
jgi:hypothetical protein